MRERLKKNMSLEGFAEHEILEMLLFYVFPRGNTNGLAHELIDRFGSLKGVMEATESELMQVRSVGENCALALKFFGLVTSYVSNEELGKVDARNYEQMLEYVRSFFTGERTEKIKVFCINGACHVQCAAEVGKGGPDHVAFDMKELTRTILNSGCSLVVLAHNHPNGENTPSQEDVIMTRRVMSYLRNLDIAVLDHYVVGINGIASMRNLGLIHDMEC